MLVGQMSRVAQAVQCLTMDWTTGQPAFNSRQRQRIFPLASGSGSGAHPASYPVGTKGLFPGGEMRQGCDADHSPPSSAKVKNEEL
jgi:hypothetical protein